MASFVPPAFRSGRDILDPSETVGIDASDAYGELLANRGLDAKQTTELKSR